MMNTNKGERQKNKDFFRDKKRISKIIKYHQYVYTFNVAGVRYYMFKCI